jgi:eukaryotic-like serine/threonine-protein kinase
MLSAQQLPQSWIADRYIVDDEIGEGGMGKVYRARHAKLGKVFALKVIAPAFAEDSIARARFVKEAHIASQISHPGIASVVDFGEDANVGAYMVMELVEGVLLVDEPAPFAVRRALDVVAQIADVLDHIHANGIIHGDVKLENIMLVTENDGPRRRQAVKLLDFGLAERMGTRPAHLAGTPEYVAPERIAGGPPTEQSDIYALGVLAFRLLTGVFPFEGDGEDMLRAHLEVQPPAMSKLRGEDLDEAVENLIRRALAKRPCDRHASASAFRYELNTVMDMLAMTRRRTRTGLIKADSRRDAMINVLFEKSPYAQAVVQKTGNVEIANEAFVQLFEACEGATVGPGLLESVRHAFTFQESFERKLGKHLVAFAPFVGETVHVLVRV